MQATFTNPENGQSVVLSNSGQVSDPAPVVDEEAGTITFTTSFKGLPEKIQTANGAVLLRVAGFITIRNTFDLETDEYIRRGMDPASARRKALLSSGGIPQAAEAVRDQRSLPWLLRTRSPARPGRRSRSCA